ncbi:MAG: hypothetical protein A3G23_05910 [Bacteroidetes bacterium RIFCSPLOWO2_12_FULL_37_12]|nr:MAG: hypothetical protein A3G23_05910 [Bacteroidetes bacterium RIFCSPLOWO2_12_FULL_37_12]
MKPLKTFLTALCILMFNNISTKAVTYLQASKSVNGPWSSDSLIIFTTDSLFFKFDLEVPGGSVRLAPIIDANGNGIIDTSDFVLEDSSIIFITDNGSVTEDGETFFDLDPALGTVIRNLSINDAPAFRVMCRLIDQSSFRDILVVLKNTPADFLLSGNLYKPDGNPLTAGYASVEPVGDSVRRASFTNYNGYYEIPLNAGTYQVGFNTMDGEYQGWDTTVTISGDMVINYQFRENNSYIRGYVIDQDSNSLGGVKIRFNGGKSAETDSTGMYEATLPSGDNRVSIDKDWLLINKYLHDDRNNHNFNLTDNDSIISTPETNFILYKSNSTIKGTILLQNPVSLRLNFNVNVNDFHLSGDGFSDPNTGNFTLDVYSGVYQGDTLKYWIGIVNDDDKYPFPDGFYSFPSGINEVLPGKNNLKFEINPNETNFADSFNMADGSPFDWNNWGSGYANSSNTWEQDSNNIIQIKDSSAYLSVTANNHDIAQEVITLGYKGYSVKNSSYEFDLDASGVGSGTFRFSLFNSGNIYLGPSPLDQGEYNKTLFLNYTKTGGWSFYQAFVRDQSLDYNYRNELLLSIPDTNSVVNVKLIFSDNKKIKIYLNDTQKGEITWATFLNAGFPFFHVINYKNLPANNIRIDNFMIYPDTLSTGLAKCLSVSRPVSLYPNPTSNNISFFIYSQEGGSTRVELINTLGVKVHTLNYYNSFSSEIKGAIDLSQLRLPKGVYFLRIRNSQGVFTSKVIYE